MPISDTLSDKLEVVLDIGTAYTKFGFAGEYAPRAIIRTEVRCKQSHTIRRIFDYKDETDLYDLLVDFIHDVYFKYTLYSPKEKAIVIVESVLSPTVFRETLAKVLFVHYEVPMLFVLPSHLVSLAPLGVETALVVDVGYEEAVAIPVCHGHAVLNAWQALPLGAKYIHQHLKQLLGQENTALPDISESTLEDIKVRCCFVTKSSRAVHLSSAKPELAFAPDVEYPIGGELIVNVSGKVREKAYEVLYDEDNDHLCLSTMILDAILKCDIHVRKTLAENLFIIGGTAMAPGFKSRLKDELVQQLRYERYKTKLAVNSFKFHSPPGKENYVSWLGGAVYAATELLHMKCITKEMYFKENRLPDWPNMRDNQKAINI